jgi:type IV pilus assembly protein PilP
VVVVLSLSGAALVLGACGEEEAVQRGVGGGAPSTPSDGTAATPAPQGSPSPAGTPEDDVGLGTPVKERELPEAAFIETDENRDPFRSYLKVFAAQAIPEPTLAPHPPVLLGEVSVDELRLIAIVSGEGGNPRAMVVDPAGKGWIVRRGDYIGRGEQVRLGPGQPEREINWRVVRVRPDRIILVREDPVQAGPPVTRIMRLYPEGEDI